MVSAEEDYPTWVVYLTDLLDENPNYLSMIDEFVQLLTHFVIHRQLPSSLLPHSDEFIKITAPSIFEQLLRLKPFDSQESQLFLDLLVQISIQCIILLTHDYDSVFRPLFRIFHPKSVPLFQTNLQIYKIFCRNFIEKSGLLILKSRLKSSENPPKLFHFFIFLWINLQIDGLLLIGRGSLAAALRPMWKRFPQFLENLDDKSLRAADSEQLFEIVRRFFNMTRFPKLDRSALIISILNFAMVCLRSDFVEKQVLATKILTLSIDENNESIKPIISRWLETSNLYSLIIEREFHDQILSQLIHPLRFLSIIRGPSESELIGLWGAVCRSSVLNLTYILAWILRSADEEVRLRFIDQILQQPIARTKLSFLQLVADFSGDLIASKIAEFIISLLRTPEFAETAVETIAAMAGMHRRTALCSLLVSRCKREAVKSDAPMALLETLTDLLESPAHSEFVNEQFVGELVNSLGNSNSQLSVLRLIAVCVQNSVIQFTDEQFNQFWEALDRQSLNLLSYIIQRRNLSFVSQESIVSKIAALNFRTADRTFAEFICSVTAARRIESQRNLEKLELPMRFQIRQLDGTLDFVLRVINEAESQSAIDYASHWLLEVLLRAAIPVSLIAPFLINSFRDTILSTDLFMNKQHIILLIWRYIAESEWEIGIEDYGLSRHCRSKLVTHMNLTLRWGDITKQCEVHRSMLISKLCEKAGILFNLPKDSILLIKDHKILRNTFSLYDCDIYHETTLTIRTQIPVQPVIYSAEEVPTHAFHIAGLSTILLELLRRDCDPLALKNVWHLLKFLETDLNIQKIASTSEGAIQLISSGKPPYELLYNLQCILLVIKNNPSLCEPVSEAILAELQNGRILDKAVAPAFQIACKAKKKTLEKSTNWLVSFILNRLTELKTKKVQSSSIFLLHCLADADSETTSEFLLVTQFADLFLTLNECSLQYLAYVFPKFPRKSRIFNFLRPFISEIQMFHSLCKPFFRLFDGIVTEDCEVADTIELILTKLPNAESPYRLGLANLLGLILQQKPSEIKNHLNSIDILIPIIVSEIDPNCQKFLLKICSTIILANPSTADHIANLLHKPFSLSPGKWNFDAAFLHRTCCFTGLRNHGATCYLNSVFQQLFANRTLRLSIAESHNNTEWFREFKSIIVRLQLTQLPYLETSNFCKHSSFNGMPSINPIEQQDAAEFCQWLLDQIGPEISSSYRGRVINIIEGTTTDYRSHILEDFVLFTVVVKDHTDLKSSLIDFITEEQVISDYTAENYGKIEVRKHSRIAELPDILIVHLKRFEYDLETWRRYKIDSYFEFPNEFDFGPFTATPANGEQLYQLTGVIVHDGHAEAGHYYSFIMIDNLWYCFNDILISSCHAHIFQGTVFGGNVTADDEGTGRSAYLLFYTRDGIDHNYFVPNSELIRRIPINLWETIEAENKLYTHNQAVFSEEMSKFVIESLTDLRILLEYFVNVVLHSKNAISAAKTYEKMNKILKLNPEKIGETISFVVEQQEHIFQAFQFCITDDILDYLSRLLIFLVKRAPSEAHFIDYFFAHLDVMIGSWRRLPFVSLPIKKYLLVTSLSTELKIHYLQILIDFILQLLSGKRNSTFLQELDLEDILDSISLIFEYLTKKQFQIILSKSFHILASQRSSISFLNFIYLGIENSFITFQAFLNFITTQKSAPLEDSHTNLIMAVIRLAEDDQDLLSKLTSLEQVFVAHDIIETIIQFSQDECFREKLFDHSHLLLFQYLIEEDFLLRDSTEQAIANLFNILPFKTENRAEFYLRSSSRLTSFESPLLHDDLEFPNDSLPKFITDLCRFCRDSAGKILTILEGDDDPQTRFTSILRILRLFLIRCNLSNEIFNKSVWLLFVAVSNSPARGGCNLCEFIRLFAQFPEKNQFLNTRSDEFIRCVFPIQFNTELQLSIINFLEVLELISFLAINLKSNPAFCETYRTFFNLPLKNSAYIWGITRMITLVAKDRLVAELVISLLEEGFPFSVIPVVVEIGLPLHEIGFRSLLDATIRACEETVSKPLIQKYIFSCGKGLFEMLECNLKKFRAVSAPIHPFLSAYLSPSSAGYLISLQRFILGIVECDEAVRRLTLDLLIGCKDDVEQDVRVVWKWLALRLQVGVTEEEKVECLEVALEVMERFDFINGKVFIQAILIVWGEEGDDRNPVNLLERFMRGIEKVCVWEKEAMTEILETVKEGEKIMEGLRAILELAEKSN